MKVLKRLDSLERFGWRFGLGNIRALLAELGDPQGSLRCVHVAGSNGKGSTCAFMSSFLRGAGYRTGLYTSPHLCDLRERFRIDGRWILPARLEGLAKRVLAACGRARRKTGQTPTHFEALTALAFCWFQEEKVDWAVLETGLGGRLDATNVIPEPGVSLITPIGLEHEAILGNSLEKIAWEKAGILKASCPAATVQRHPGALRTLEKAARERGVLLWRGGREFTFRKTSRGFHWEGPGLSRDFRLEGASYQMGNAALALAGVQILRAGGDPIPTRTLQPSLSRAKWPGRMELLLEDPPVILDGAHNPAAVLALAGSLRSSYPGKKWLVLNGFLEDKDHLTAVSRLKDLTLQPVVTEPPTGRAAGGEKVFRSWEKAGLSPVLIRDWDRALSFAMKKRARYGCPLLVTGSLYLIGACRKALAGTKGLERV